VRYVTYASPTGPRVGFLDGDDVWDAGVESDMVGFIVAGAQLGQTARVGPARLLAPLRPRSMRDFLTFKGHLDNALSRLGQPIPRQWFSVPAYYKGMPDTVIGTDAEIPWPPYTSKLDYELELACVIGRAGRDIAAHAAMDFVFGYTIWNDVSARDVQTEELPIGMGPGKAKDWDGSNVLGPCIVTADEFDGRSAAMEVRVNGEVRGSDTTAHMHHTFGDLIAYASMAQMLYPGEILGSGTAAGGSGLEQDRWINAGDLIEMTVVGLGTLRNRVGRKGQA
jgi:2-keto-4-pentenoate hydratase/2-oxohepta-3-ene-1,7-dioic acid hydratase in catechol pathway